jgi:hypothetical protein
MGWNQNQLTLKMGKNVTKPGIETLKLNTKEVFTLNQRKFEENVEVFTPKNCFPAHPKFDSIKKLKKHNLKRHLYTIYL